MAQVYLRAHGNRAAVMHMAMTRSQLVDELLALDEELLRIDADGVQEEAVQKTLQYAVNASTQTVGQRD
ncbi:MULTISPECIES: hypothetical protein [Dyella]|uniref:hypothetical protein n=1 Tax=Dyella TaxID=231454 RepID=UPI0019168B3A|nr:MULTISPECIES: hypothetical protein [Dyella]